ncbi:MAG: winged helix-turn-helix domain-containing protein [Oceanococcus sp.]
MSSAKTEIYRFGRIIFDQRNMTINISGVYRDVPLKSLQVLRELVRRPGELVTKNELIDTCWGGESTSDTVLTTTVGRLRQALNEDQSGHIETVTGHGYKLVEPVIGEAADMY